MRYVLGSDQHVWEHENREEMAGETPGVTIVHHDWSTDSRDGTPCQTSRRLRICARSQRRGDSWTGVTVAVRLCDSSDDSCFCAYASLCTPPTRPYRAKTVAQTRPAG